LAPPVLGGEALEVLRALALESAIEIGERDSA